MSDEQISIRDRRKIRRAARHEAYEAVKAASTLEEAQAIGRRRMEANYSSIWLAIGLFIIGKIIEWLWSKREETGVLPALPPNWETKFDAQ